NLYRVIKRLVDADLIAESDHRAAPDLGEERRRYYKLTALGGQVLAAELQPCENWRAGSRREHDTLGARVCADAPSLPRRFSRAVRRRHARRVSRSTR